MAWTKHFVEKSSDYEGYVVSKEQLLSLIEEFELETHSRYAISRSRYTYNIYMEDIKWETMKVVWVDPKASCQKVQPNIPDDGIALMHLGSCTMSCHRGSKRAQKKKEVNEQVTSILMKKSPISKKLDCPSIIKIRRVIKFPEYRIENTNSVKHSKEMVAVIHKLLSDEETRVDVEMENRWYVCLPQNSSHQNHIVGQEETDAKMDIDKRLSTFIHDKVLRENICNTKEMLSLVRIYVEDVLFKDKPLPPKSNVRYWPTLTHIRNHIMMTNTKRRDIALNQDELENLVKKWWLDYPEDSIMLRLKTNKKENGKKLDELPGGKFLFVQQTCWQRKLLYMYGDEVCILDVYKPSKYSLNHYFIVVPTNCMYLVVASFIIESEDKLDLEEALSFIKSWNPGWAPRCFMTNYSEAEMAAVATVFSECNTEILVCDFLRQQFWTRWLSAKINNVGIYKEELMVLMKNIAESYAEDEFQESLQALRANEGWRSNMPLQRSFERWINNAPKWVKYHRQGKYIIVDTFKEMEKLNGVIRQMFLNEFSNDTTQTVTELAQILLSKFLPFLHNKYTQTNLMWRIKARSNNLDVPSFLHDRPPHFVEHLSSRWESTQDITNLIQQDSQGSYHVISLPTGETYQIEVDNGHGIPSCNCSDWRTYHYPCKHILAGFTSGYYMWTDLPTHYTSNPILMLDTTFVSTPKNMDNLEAVEKLKNSPGTDLIQEAEAFRSRLQKLESYSHLSCNIDVFKRLNAILKECEEDISSTCPKDGHFLKTYEFNTEKNNKKKNKDHSKKGNAKRKFDETSMMDFGDVDNVESVKIEAGKIDDVETVFDDIETEIEQSVVETSSVRPSIVIKTRMIKNEDLYSSLLSL